MLIWVALSIVSIIAVAAIIAVLQVNSKLSRSQVAAAETLHTLRQDLEIVNGAAMGVGQRLIAVEKKLNISIEKQEQMNCDNADLLPYSQAASLAESGADVEELIEKYGLPEAEANLLSLMKSSPK